MSSQASAFSLGQTGYCSRQGLGKRRAQDRSRIVQISRPEQLRLLVGESNLKRHVASVPVALLYPTNLPSQVRFPVTLLHLHPHADPCLVRLHVLLLLLPHISSYRDKARGRAPLPPLANAALCNPIALPPSCRPNFCHYQRAALVSCFYTFVPVVPARPILPERSLCGFSTAPYRSERPTEEASRRVATFYPNGHHGDYTYEPVPAVVWRHPYFIHLIFIASTGHYHPLFLFLLRCP
jgi:hypothetical protein